MASHKVRLLLTSAVNGRAALEGALARAARRLPGVAASGMTFAWGARLAGDAIADTKHREALGPPPDQFDVLVDISSGDASDPRLAAAVKSLLDEVGASADLARSALTAGSFHTLMPAVGAYMMTFALRPLPTLTPEQFFDYWVNHHAPLVVKSSRGKGSYHHVRAEPEQSRIAERFHIGVSDYLGHAGGWMDDPSDLGRFLRHPIALAALDDERRFIDHKRSFIGVYAIAGA